MSNKLNRQENKTHHTQRGRRRRCRFLQKTKKFSMRKNRKSNVKKDRSGSCRCFSSAVMEPSVQRKITWSKLFDASVVVTRVDWEEVFEPGNVWVGVPASSTEHGGGTGALDHLELRAHVYGGETCGQLILWNTATPAQSHTNTHMHFHCSSSLYHI